MLWNGNNHLNEIRLLSWESGRRAETKKFKTIVSQTKGYTETNAAIKTTIFRKAKILFE